MLKTLVIFCLCLVLKCIDSCYVFPVDSTDPCRDKLCPVGARCVPSPDGRAATCVCPKYCPQYGDHSASRPVCGSDKNDYKDQCEMRKNACEKGVEISVKYQGACGKYTACIY